MAVSSSALVDPTPNPGSRARQGGGGDARSKDGGSALAFARRRRTAGRTSLRFVTAAMRVAMLVGGVSGCESMTTVVTVVELPAEVPSAARTPERLHVRIDTSPTTAEPIPLVDGACPAAEPSGGPTPDVQPETTANGFRITQSRIPSVPSFCAAAWFDTNDNQRIDTGDAIGRLGAPYLSPPSTLRGPNRHESPPLVLTLVP